MVNDNQHLARPFDLLQSAIYQKSHNWPQPTSAAECFHSYARPRAIAKNQEFDRVAATSGNLISSS
jgi:hypothetical protein